MKVKQVTAAEFGLQTGKFLEQAKRGPIVVRSGKGQVILLRAMSEDDLVDELILANPRFQASVRRARRNKREGKGIPLAEARKILGV